MKYELTNESMINTAGKRLFRIKALVANILGDKKKITFYILGLVICMLAVVFIYYAQDIFAAFLHWVSK